MVVYRHILVWLPLALNACGQDSSDDSIAEPTAAVNVNGSPQPPTHTPGLSFVATTGDLPACDDTNEGQVVYVQASSTFHGCQSESWEAMDLRGPSGKDGVDGSHGKTTRVRDGDGSDLGLLTAAGQYGLTTMSIKGYLYHPHWDGGIQVTAYYYSSTDCSGVPRTHGNPGYAHSGKGLHADSAGKLFKPAVLDSDGNAVVATFSYSSHFNTNTGQCETASSSVNTIELTPISRADAGIPATITPPISIVSE